MKKTFSLLTLLLLAAPALVHAQLGEQCFPDKVISKETSKATLKSYYIEEVMEIPSDVNFIINGKEVNATADPEFIEQHFKNKEGKKFNVTIEKIFGWIGDGCDEYLKVTHAKLIK